MIAYLPELYEDELVYSWFARYFAHMYPSYTNALEDLLENRNIRTDVEFINRLHPDAKASITKIIPMEELILQHTMFPYYRFSDNARLCNALESMAETGEYAHKLLPVPKNRTNEQVRYMKYCPICATEARDVYGEAYWTRLANVRNIDVCVKHRCRLKATRIEISGKKSGRLYVAEEEIHDTVSEIVEDSLELQLARYMTEVFQLPVSMEHTITIGEFLNSKLEGTKYLSARGKMRNVSLFFDDIMGFYWELPTQGLTALSQMQKIFTGYRWDFYEICQMAYFLGINADELVNRKLPEQSQTEIFNAEVAQLYEQGLGYHRIARKLGCSSSTARKANQIKRKTVYDYSGRKGIKKADWDQMDNDMLRQVRDACEQIYHNNGKRPGRVTVYAVCRVLEFPSKRFDYLPKCRDVIQKYAETYPLYWAREVVWCYQHLIDSIGEDAIRWRDIRDATNLRKDNFFASFPYLEDFADAETADKIKNLLPDMTE